jgi:hypothetical protein
MNPLMMLLGQQAGAPAAEDAYQGNIPVERNRHRGTGGAAYDDYALNNVPAVTGRQADITQTEEASDRRGMFGMKGTLRDVIGLVGDAFLMQSGNNPVYAPTRQRERISDAWAGASEKPIAAAERVGYYDAGMGQDLLKDAQTASRADKTVEVQRQRLAQASAEDKRQWYKDASARISQGFAAALQTGSPEAIAQAMSQARKESEISGIPLEQLGVTPEMTREAMQVLAGRGATVSQTMRFPLEQARVDISRIQAEVAQGRLGVARQMAGIAARNMNLRENSQEWDEFMDYVGIGQAAAKQATSGDKPTTRALPGAKKLQIRPVQ